MTLDPLVSSRRVLQLILKNPIELPYEFGCYNVTNELTHCCTSKDLELFLRAKKQQLIQTWSLCLDYFHADLVLDS